MQEQIIVFDTAKLAKEKGFRNVDFTMHFYTKHNSKMFGVDEHGRAYTIKNIYKKLYTCGEHTTLNTKNVIEAPTQSLLQKWLREVHGIVVTVSHWTKQPVNSEIWKNCFDYNFQDDDHGTTPHKTYEEALEEGLKAGLKLIKDEI